MIDSLEPEFPRFAAWWRRQRVATRALLAVPLLFAMTLGIIVMFVSIFTWMPFVHAIGELTGRNTQG